MNYHKKIAAPDLVCMNDCAGAYIHIDLAYAREDNHLFGQRIYKADAKLWLHRDLADIVQFAGQHIHETMGGKIVLYDGLRCVDAQAAMLKTQRVRDNPQWLEEPRLLSPPGSGAHPRAMAIDVSIMDANGVLLDMGTPFDDLTEKAHRNYPHSDAVMDNRRLLDEAMIDGALRCGVEILLLPQEWWDFRLPRAVYEAYAPLSDADLPREMWLMR